jgi:hypothetical protein
VVSKKQILYAVVPACVVLLFLLVFFQSPNSINNFSFSNNKDSSDNQDIPNIQKQEQKEIDDYYLRGAISGTSGGKQVLEKYQTHLCGASFEKRTYFIQEYTLPFPCSQPVGITVQQQENNNDNNSSSTEPFNAMVIKFKRLLRICESEEFCV